MKTARIRFKVLALADKLGNVAEACRRCDVDRTSFYAWRKRFLQAGIAGLKDRPAAHAPHPKTTRATTVERIKEIALSHPSFGCNRIAAQLLKEGHAVSAVTIQKILNENKVGSLQDRWRALEEKNFYDRSELSQEQVAFIEKHNPCFRDRNLDCSGPGSLLHADTILVGSRRGLGILYLHAVVDGWSGFAFGALASTNEPEVALGLMTRDVLPFLGALGLVVKLVLTGRGREFSGPGWHPYQRFLVDRNIAQRIVEGPHRLSGTIERFRQASFSELLRPCFKAGDHGDLQNMQAKLTAWLALRNYERISFGFRCYGKTPAQAAGVSVNSRA